MAETCINCGKELTTADGSKGVAEATGEAVLGDMFPGARLCDDCTNHPHFEEIFPQCPSPK